MSRWFVDVAAFILAVPMGFLGFELSSNSVSLLSAFLLFIPAFLTALAVLRRTTRSAKNIDEKTDAIEEMLSTGNGRDIGNTVHDIAMMQQVLSAQNHTNTKEILYLVEVLQHCQEMHEDILERLSSLEKG
jgi:hypothetical protein